MAAASSVVVEQIKNWESLKQVIAEEVNVKEVIASEVPTGEVLLDTNITEELREEGMVRDVIRAVQAFRKLANLKPGEPGLYRMQTPTSCVWEAC